jgi:ribosomal protein S18 acetylase RimI-like enzyme
MQSISIRDAVKEDASIIRDMAYKIWPVAYKEILTPEQLTYMLDLLYNEHTLQEQMQKGTSFIIVNEGDEAVGFASWGLVDDDAYKLHKIYVLPSQQGKGTGRLMIDHVINDIKARGAHTILLNVNRHNKAINFYEKLGFFLIREEDVDIGNGYFMNDYVMAKNLKE